MYNASFQWKIILQEISESQTHICKYIVCKFFLFMMTMGQWEHLTHLSPSLSLPMFVPCRLESVQSSVQSVFRFSAVFSVHRCLHLSPSLASVWRGPPRTHRHSRWKYRPEINNLSRKIKAAKLQSSYTLQGLIEILTKYWQVDCGWHLTSTTTKKTVGVSSQFSISRRN